MECKKCAVDYCLDEECGYCEPILVIGVCSGCNTEQKCHQCGNIINPKKDIDCVRNAMYEYWCTKACHAMEGG